MCLKLYVPLSIGFFAFVTAGASYLGAPVAPFAIVVLFAETLIGLQLEDNKVQRFLKSLAGSTKAWHVH